MLGGDGLAYSILKNGDNLKKSPVDLQELTAIQQNNFTPQPPPSRGPITLTVCVTPHPSTTSRQHYFQRTAPLYMERRIYFRSNIFGGERGGAFVNLFGPGNVTFEADDRKLGFSHAGINVAARMPVPLSWRRRAVRGMACGKIPSSNSLEYSVATPAAAGLWSPAGRRLSTSPRERAGPAG